MSFRYNHHNIWIFYYSCNSRWGNLNRIDESKSYHYNYLLTTNRNNNRYLINFWMWFSQKIASYTKMLYFSRLIFTWRIFSFRLYDELRSAVQVQVQVYIHIYSHTYVHTYVHTHTYDPLEIHLDKSRYRENYMNRGETLSGRDVYLGSYWTSEKETRKENDGTRRGEKDVSPLDI